MSGPQVVVDEGTGVALNLPPGWERVDSPVAQLAVAGPATQAAADGTVFRPNVGVLVADVADEVDVRTLGTAAVAAAMATVEGVHVLSYDLWLGPEVDGAPVEGRRLEFAYQQGAVPLGAVQWVVLAAGSVTTVTATCGVAQLTVVRPAVDHALAGLRLPGGAR